MSAQVLQAGGQFPVPIVTGFTAAGLQGVTFIPYGVSLAAGALLALAVGVGR